MPYPGGPHPVVPCTVLPRSSPVALALAGMATLAVAMAIGRFAFTPLLPMMQSDAGLLLGTGAALASANYFGYFIGSATALAIAGATHRWIRAGLLVVSAGTGAMAFTDLVWLWFVLRFVTGVASAWVLILASTWMFNRLVEAGQPRWGALVFTGVGGGIAATGAVCFILVLAGASSHATWLVLGLLSSVITATVWRFYQPGASVGRSVDPAGAVRYGGPARRLIAVYALYGFAYIVPATFLPLMARDALAVGGAAAWWYAGFWPLVGVAAALSTLFTLRLKMSDDRQLRWALLAEAVGVVAPVLSLHPAAIALSAVLVGGTFVLITLTALRVARAVDPVHGTRLFAVMTTLFALGQIAGPLVAGRMVALYGNFSLALAAAAACLLLAALLTPVAGTRSSGDSRLV